MDETRKPTQAKSEFAQDKEKAILTGLGAVTGAAAVGAAVYSHEASEDGRVETSGGEESESSVHSVQQNEGAGPADVPDGGVEVIVAEGGDGTLSSDNVWLADDVHLVEVEGSDVELLLDAENDGTVWSDAEVLNSDEQIISDLQGNDDVWEGASYISGQPDGLENMDDNTGFDNGDSYSYMA